MRTTTVVFILTAMVMLIATSTLQAGSPVDQKLTYQKNVSQKDGSTKSGGLWCGHCKEDRGSRGTTSRDTPQFMPYPPMGAVVESVPVTRAVPSLVSMPMMTGIPVSGTAVAATNDNDERIDELDARVEALHLRMMTIQRSIELQTKILEELRDNGSIGGTRLPGLP